MDEEERNDNTETLRVIGWTSIREQTGQHAQAAGDPGKGLLCNKWRCTVEGGKSSSMEMVWAVADGGDLRCTWEVRKQRH